MLPSCHTGLAVLHWLYHGVLLFQRAEQSEPVIGVVPPSVEYDTANHYKYTHVQWKLGYIKPEPFARHRILSFTNYFSTPRSNAKADDDQMETLQAPYTAAEASESLLEQTHRSASWEAAGQHAIDSPTSTIPLDDGSFVGLLHERQSQSNDALRAGTLLHPIMIDDSEEDRLIWSPSHRRKRKRGLVTSDMEDVTSILVSIFYLSFHPLLTVYRTIRMKKFDVITVRWSARWIGLSRSFLFQRNGTKSWGNRSKSWRNRSKSWRSLRTLSVKYVLTYHGVIIGCGHIICTSSVKQMFDHEMFWGHPCPAFHIHCHFSL